MDMDVCDRFNEVMKGMTYLGKDFVFHSGS